eukprot:3693948-Rhodomonas_salina.4
MEVTFPPVPNLEEVDFGTALNFQFSKEIREEMGILDVKVRSHSARARGLWCVSERKAARGAQERVKGEGEGKVGGPERRRTGDTPSQAKTRRERSEGVWARDERAGAVWADEDRGAAGTGGLG